MDPPGGGRAKIENSSRRHPRKFGLKRFLAVRRSWRGKWGGLFLGYLLGKNFRRRDRDHLVPPRRTDAEVCRAELCYPFGRKHGRHRAVRRREFITLLGGAAAAWPLAASAQQRARVYRVGWSFSSGEMSVQFSDPFQQSLREAGFVDGQNVLFERRFGRGVYERLPALAAELLALHVDLLAAFGTPAVRAAKTASMKSAPAIPIIFAMAADPVAEGFVESFNRPGGNMTGVTSISSTLAPKRLDLMREFLRDDAPIAMLINPHNPISEAERRDTE